MDLLGADLPAASGAAGDFAWCDGPLLSALKAGHWVLLDELNLASKALPHPLGCRSLSHMIFSSPCPDANRKDSMSLLVQFHRSALRDFHAPSYITIP